MGRAGKTPSETEFCLCNCALWDCDAVFGGRFATNETPRPTTSASEAERTRATASAAMAGPASTSTLFDR